MISYDTKASLLQFLWILPSTKLKKHQDPLLSQRTNVSRPQIITLLEFCLKNISRLFQSKYYEQVYDDAMGYP